MNESAEIRIFKPFDESFTLMKRILFQPFDLSKWLVVGFAAFIAGHINSGAGFGFSFPGNFNSARSHRGHPPDFGFNGQHGVLFISVFVGLIIFILIVAFVFAWVRARGTFVFTDCIVRNRAAIKEPWHEYRPEGNSYFLFLLAVAGIILVIVAIIGGLIFLLAVALPHDVRLWTMIAVGAIAVFVYFGVVVVFSILNYFMPMVMYRRRCRAWEACREVAALVWKDPGSFVLFCLFGVVLFIGWIMAAGVVTCATCCMAILPYVGTVLLLPVFVWFRAYGMLFFRQFGADYDVWGGADPLPAQPPVTAAAPTPAVPPPPQTPPPAPAV